MSLTKTNYRQVAAEDFAFNSLLKITLVREEREKEYKRGYYAFASALPKGNGTYISDHHISFKLELPQLVALSEAIRLYAMGVGTKIGPRYTIWADPGKSDHGGEEAKDRSGKCLSVTDAPRKGGQNGERVVNLTFNRGKLKNDQEQQKDAFPAIIVTLDPFDALAVSIAIRSLADFGVQKCREEFTPYARQQENHGMTGERHLPPRQQSSPPAQTRAPQSAEKPRASAPTQPGRPSPQQGNRPTSQPASGPAPQTTSRPAAQPASKSTAIPTSRPAAQRDQAQLDAIRTTLQKGFGSATRQAV